MSYRAPDPSLTGPFLVISGTPCPRCGGSGTLTDYDGRDRAYEVRCNQCRGTGGELVSLEDALAALNSRIMPL